MKRKRESDTVYFWVRTNADGTREVAPDVEGAPGEFGTDEVELGPVGVAPWWRRMLRRFVDWVQAWRGKEGR